MDWPAEDDEKVIHFPSTHAKIVFPDGEGLKKILIELDAKDLIDAVKKWQQKQSDKNS